MGKVNNATPSGRYRSKLEAYTAQQLESENLEYCYECKVFTLLPKGEYPNES